MSAAGIHRRKRSYGITFAMQDQRRLCNPRQAVAQIGVLQYPQRRFERRGAGLITRE